jgi:hypothetical protein
MPTKQKIQVAYFVRLPNGRGIGCARVLWRDPLVASLLVQNAARRLAEGIQQAKNKKHRTEYVMVGKTMETGE